MGLTTASPSRIVSQSAADRNIPDRDGCGEAVEPRVLVPDPGGKVAARAGSEPRGRRRREAGPMVRLILIEVNAFSSAGDSGFKFSLHFPLLRRHVVKIGSRIALQLVHALLPGLADGIFLGGSHRLVVVSLDP